MKYHQRIIVYFTLLILSQTILGVKISDERDWFINPYDKNNPIFAGGPELFASSRIGQVYLPGAAVATLRPLYVLTTQMLAPKLGMALEGVSIEYIAHVAWRLGCDQGYLAAKELRENNHTNLDSYLRGTKHPKANHPSLSHELNQTITPTALLLFGLGQVIGQRFLGPQVKKLAGNFSIFNKKMGPKMSTVSMDEFGWPKYGATYTRATAIGKASGILFGTYLGWSLNDFGWQFANWRKFSLDPFSEYMPYHGNESFGSIDKGWGILGFTVGGFLGHNIGAGLGDHLINKTSLGKFAGKNIAKHGMAIGGNLIVGLFLTTYFPHIFRKVFGFYRPVEIPLKREVKDFTHLSSQEQIKIIKEVSEQAIDTSYTSLITSHYKSLIKLNNKLRIEKLPKISSEIKNIFINHSMEMEHRLYSFLEKIIEEVKAIQNIKQLKIWAKTEMNSFIPSDIILNKEKLVNTLINEIKLEKNLDHYKKRITSIFLYLYPINFKYRFVQQMIKLENQVTNNHDPLISNLFFLRNLVTLQLAKLFKSNPLKAENFRIEFQTLHKDLINQDISTYEKNTILNYLESLNDISSRINQ